MDKKKVKLLWIFFVLVMFSLVAVPKMKRQGMRKAFRSIQQSEASLAIQKSELSFPKIQNESVHLQAR